MVTPLHTRTFRRVGPAAALLIAVSFAADAQNALEIRRTTRITNNGNGTPGLVDVRKAVVSPDGRDLYTSEIGPVPLEAALTEFALDDFTRLQSLDGVTFASDFMADALQSPVDMAMTPDGNFLYVVSFSTSRITQWIRDAGNGSLSIFDTIEEGVNGVSGIQAPAAIAISGNQASAYVADQAGNAITHFSIDPGPGTLLFEQTLNTLSAGNPPLGTPSDVIISPDNEFVYVTSLADDAISVFDRNTTTGDLTFLGFVSRTANNIVSLDNPEQMTMDSKGNHLYVTASAAAAVNVFRRDIATGFLTFVDAEIDGVNGVNGLGTAVPIAMGLNDLYVYVAGVSDNLLAAFGRIPGTGELVFLQAADVPITQSFDGLMAPSSIAVHPTGSQVYLTGSVSQSLHAFDVITITSFTGTVTDATIGGPVTCGTIELKNDAGEVFTAVTDANGFYFFPLIPPDTYEIRIFGAGFEPTTITDEIVTIAASRVRDFSINRSSLRPDIQGVVTDAVSDAPLVAVLVRLFVNTVEVGQTYTCASGAFELQVPNPKGSVNVTLQYELDNYDTETQNLVVMSGVTTQADQAMNKSVGFPGTIAGTVVESSGKGPATPIDGATVTLRGPANATAQTDVSGAYSFEVIDGAYTIRASKNGFGGQTLNRSVAGGNTEQVLFTLDPQVGDPADVDGSGDVNAVDIQFVINGVLGLPVPVNVDVNSDGQANASDVQLTINAALGI